MGEKIDNIVSETKELLLTISSSRNQFSYLQQLEQKIAFLNKFIRKEEPLLRDNGKVSYVTKPEIVLLANLKLELQKCHRKIQTSPLGIIKSRILERRKSPPEIEPLENAKRADTPPTHTHPKSKK